MTRTATKENYPASFLARLDELEERIGYSFREREHLYIALTHSSYSNEKKSRVLFEHNERLEFLGDSVLSLIVSRHIFEAEEHFPEGILTRLRASAVCAEALYEYAEKISLGEYMLINHGLEEGGGRHQKNVLADCFEAVIAAIFLDAGMEEAERFVWRFAREKLRRLIVDGRLRDKDFKSLLQEKVQTSPGEKLEYRLVREKGPDHDKEFTFRVYLNSNAIGEGSGRSKREAEQEAARTALMTWFGEGK